MKRTSPRRAAGLALCALLAASCFSVGASLTYNGGVGGDWTNGGGGWLNGGVAATWNNAGPDAAIFGGVSPTNVVVGGGVTVGNITVSAGAYAMGGSGTLTLSGTTWDVAGGLTNTVSAALAGTTGLTKAGSGVLLFSGTNKSYTGGTVINAGAIQISSAAAGGLGSTSTEAVTLNGGPLYTLFSSNSTVNYAMSVGASGGELRNLGGDAGRFTFGANKVSGSGVLTLSFGTNNTRFILGGSTGSTQSGFTGKWVVDSGGNVNRFADIYSSINFGNVTGDDAVTLKNTGTLLLRANTYSTNSGGSAFGITLGSGGGRFSVGGSSTVVMANKISGAAGNTLTIGFDNNAVLVLSNTANSYLGDTSLVAVGTNGVLRLGASGVLADAGGTVAVGTGTAFDLNGYNEAIGGLSGGGVVDNRAASTASVLTVGSNNLSTTFSGAMSNSASGSSLALVKVGVGTLTLSGANSHAGGTSVQAGKLMVGNAVALGAGNVLLQPVETGATNRAYLALNGLTVAGKTLTMDSTTNRAVLQSTGVAGGTWNGTITLQGGASAQGNTELANDTGNGALTVAGEVNGSISGGYLTLRGVGVTNVLSAWVNIGSTPVVKTDTGAWVVTYSGNDFGALTVNAGTLELRGLNLASGAMRTEGSLTNALVFAVTSGSEYGRVNASGGAVLTNTNTSIAVKFLGGYEPTNTETYTLIDGGYSGSPALILPALSATNLSWVTNSFAATGQITVTNSTPTDPYGSWASSYGLSGTNAAWVADPDGDGFTNSSEFLFDGDPTRGTPALLGATKISNSVVFQFVARKANASYDVYSTTNVSTGPWGYDSSATGSIVVSTNQEGILLPDQYERRSFSVAPAGNRFYRVQGTTTN